MVVASIVQAGAYSGSRRRTRCLAALALVLWVSLIVAPSAAFADLQGAVGGYAFGEQTDVLEGRTTSGPLPSVRLPASGGEPITRSAASVCVPAVLCTVLRADALEAASEGWLSGSGNVRGSARVASANVGSGIVTGDVVRSQCSGSASGISGSTTLTNVRVGGLSVAAKPPRNLVSYVGGIARVTVNEQIASPNSITVNAIHVQWLSENAGDVILSQAHCDVTLSSPPAVSEPPLAGLLRLLTMAVLMGAVVVAWGRDPSLLSRSAR
jgi:hypothetical protein